MQTNIELKHRYMVSVHVSDAARYFSMHVAANSDAWRDSGLESLQDAARLLGFDFVKREPVTTAQPEAVLEDVAMGR